MDRVSLGLCSECGNVGMWKFGGWGLGVRVIFRSKVY